MSTYKHLINSTVDLLNFHQNIGVSRHTVSSKTKTLLNTPLRKKTDTVSSLPDKTKTKKPAQDQGRNSLTDIRQEIGDCTRCSLHTYRTSILFGHGSPNAKLCVIGEWPNQEDDQTGLLFSGLAGEMLDKMLTHVLHLSREEVYIASLLKCRVPDDIHPDLEHIQNCKPFLLSQLSVIRPKVICTMGPEVAHALLKTNKPLIHLRGRFHTFNEIPLMPTFHPSYLLKNKEMKKAAMVDLQMVAKKLSQK